MAILKESATTVAEFHPAIVANLNDIVKILIIVKVAELDATVVLFLNFHHCYHYDWQNPVM